MSELPLDYTSLNKSSSKSRSGRKSFFSSAYSTKTRSILALSAFAVLLLLVRFQFINESSVSKNSSLSSVDVADKQSTNNGTSEDQQHISLPTPTETYSANTSGDQYHVGGGSDGHSDEIVFPPLVISGPSGVGKGTLIEKLVSFYNHKVDEVVESNEFRNGDDGIHELFGFSVSHTTRGPRPGEVDGVHYHFTTKEQILKDIEDQKFIEHAQVHGNIYGTSYESVQNVISSHRICILDIDVQGAKRVKEDSSLLIKPYFIFIAPPSMEVLEQRLRGRGTETEEAIQTRLGNAQSELDYGRAEGNFDQVIVNDDIEHSFLQLRQVLEEWYPHLNQIPSPSYEF
mmetsp:Transcript_16556/g.24762  ORF Transcript_16556/g.24762 Transcript_16556/m.24762 type:complete len:343 (+) Transcript_16556:129-1157(+)